jgi:histidinol-phosphate aminotransferase
MAILGLAPTDTPTRPAHFDIERVIRPNILALKPYRCARDDYTSGVLLDANENALGPALVSRAVAAIADGDVQATAGLNLHRYPDPSHPDIKARIAELRGLPGPDHVFLGVGSDEVIDLLIRVCVAPERERILTTPPTYGMYAVCAQVNDIGVTRVPLEVSGEHGEGGEKGRFSVNLEAVGTLHVLSKRTLLTSAQIKKAVAADPSIKLVFLCSPGNPTGTLIPLSVVRELLEYEPYKGIVVVDEAYIDFADDDASATTLVRDYANVVVMQTLSKSFGLAAIRYLSSLGATIAC